MFDPSYFVASLVVVYPTVSYYLIKANIFQMSKTGCWTTQKTIFMHWVWIYYLDSTSGISMK